jgi:hypothetical protein
MVWPWASMSSAMKLLPLLFWRVLRTLQPEMSWKPLLRALTQILCTAAGLLSSAVVASRSTPPVFWSPVTVTLS